MSPQTGQRSSLGGLLVRLLLLGVPPLLGVAAAAQSSSTSLRSCVQVPSPCGGNSTCVNTTTYYQCTCPKGYMYDRTLKTCVDVDECAVTNPPCVSPDDFDTANNTRCVNTPGSYRCECPPGYQLIQQWVRRYILTYACVDIDECQTMACGDPAATCVNREGSYVCRCPDTTYYDAKSKKCVDVNECAVTNSPCGGSSICTDQPGGYSCGCPANSGLAYVATMNDCLADLCSPQTCGGNSTCGMSSPTSYFCGCAPGFAYNATLRTCTSMAGLDSMRVEAGQICPTDSTTCPINDGTSCGLYFAKALKPIDNLSKTWPCNRLISPNGKFKMVVLYSGQVVIYNGTKIFWQTVAPALRERRSLLLQEDGTWVLWDIDADWSTDYSGFYGTTLLENIGPEQGPFIMRMGNDGRAQIVNGLGAIAWTSDIMPPAAGRRLLRG
ncbi:hypothetical protein Vretifemale_9486 [Volvox reticuliferus]|uniref:EGF-like domain-containing protein n=1 Tax=Volvox reticuliferus TaxID=1737510 RepID=A0A8J4CEX1_9CHLO|nr:hypothetical protein Vretifemale_9486 [Volvox reticuliferus]